MWLEAINFLGLDRPNFSSEFMLVNELKHNDSKKVSQFLVEQFKNLTLRRMNIIE